MLKLPLRYAMSAILVFSSPLMLVSAQKKSEKDTVKPASTTPTPSTTATTSPRPALAFGLQDGTPVRLRIARTISSADAKVGETVDFEVLEDVKINDTVVIPRGGIALATVTEAQSKRRMGRGGKLNVNIDSARLVSGEKIALRAIKDAEGGGHVGAMTGAIVATSIVFFPAAPLFLFMKGKDITIPKGTEITGYINGDIELNPAKFAPATGQNAVANNSAPVTTATKADDDMVSLVIKSDPIGAEITIDGKFVGSTPSTIPLKTGEHKVLIQKGGFAVWERTISLHQGANITLDASLVKAN